MREFEHRLQGVLNPVSPDQNFIDRLYVRLKSSPEVILERRPRLLAAAVIAFSLVVGGVLLIVFTRGGRPSSRL